MRRKRASAADSAHSTESIANDDARPVGESSRRHELRSALRPHANDDEKTVTERLGELDLSERRCAGDPPRADHMVALDEREESGGGRSANDDLRSAIGRSSGGCSSGLRCRRKRRSGTPDG